MLFYFVISLFLWEFRHSILKRTRNPEKWILIFIGLIIFIFSILLSVWEGFSNYSMYIPTRPYSSFISYILLFPWGIEIIQSMLTVDPPVLSIEISFLGNLLTKLYFRLEREFLLLMLTNIGLLLFLFNLISTVLAIIVLEVIKGKNQLLKCKISPLRKVTAIHIIIILGIDLICQAYLHILCFIIFTRKTSEEVFWVMEQLLGLHFQLVLPILALGVSILALIAFYNEKHQLRNSSF